MGRYTSRSADETVALGQKLGSLLSGGEAIAFTGGLGSGKTTFCRGIAAGLGSVDQVSSPTFAVANLYRGPLPFAHFDAYRVAGMEDLETAGLYDYRDRGVVVAVEWSERVAGMLEEPLILVDIAFAEGNPEHRIITIEGAPEL